MPKPGKLQLRIVADPDSHAYIIDALSAEINATSNVVYDQQTRGEKTSKEAVGRWVRVGRQTKPVNGEFYPRAVLTPGSVIRDGASDE